MVAWVTWETLFLSLWMRERNYKKYVVSPSPMPPKSPSVNSRASFDVIGVHTLRSQRYPGDGFTGDVHLCRSQVLRRRGQSR